MVKVIHIADSPLLCNTSFLDLIVNHFKFLSRSNMASLSVWGSLLQPRRKTGGWRRGPQHPRKWLLRAPRPAADSLRPEISFQRSLRPSQTRRQPKWPSKSRPRVSRALDPSGPGCQPPPQPVVPPPSRQHWRLGLPRLLRKSYPARLRWWGPSGSQRRPLCP